MGVADESGGVADVLCVADAHLVCCSCLLRERAVKKLSDTTSRRPAIAVNAHRVCVRHREPRLPQENRWPGITAFPRFDDLARVVATFARSVPPDEHPSKGALKVMYQDVRGERAHGQGGQEPVASVASEFRGEPVVAPGGER